MLKTYGIFDDDGLLEDGYDGPHGYQQAMAVAFTAYDDDDGVYVAELCSEHSEWAADTCPECYSDEY